MRIRRFLFGTLLFRCLLLLAFQAHLAWAKDDDVLTVAGFATFNVDRGTVTIDTTTLKVEDGTYLSLNDLTSEDDDRTLNDLAAFAHRNPHAAATGEYLLINGAPVATMVSLSTAHDLLGTPTVDVAKNQVQIGDLTLDVTDNTTINIGEDYPALEDMEAYLQSNPSALFYIEYEVDGTNLTADYLMADTDTETTGPLTVDVANSQVTVGQITVTVDENTDLTVNYADATLADLAAAVTRHPGAIATLDFTVGDTPTASELDLDTTTVVYGPITVDPQAQTVTINGLTLDASDEPYISNNEDDGFSLDDLAELASEPGGASAYVRYDPDSTPPSVVDVYVNDGNGLPDFLQNYAHPAFRRLRRRNVVGRFAGADATHHTVTFVTRRSGMTRTLRVGPHTHIELNAAKLPFEQLAGALTPGQPLWLEATYPTHARVAKRIWIEHSLQEGAGEVLGIRPTPHATGKAQGVTLTVAVRSPRTTAQRASQFQVFPHSLVLRGSKLVRPQSIRTGDIILFDGFQSSGVTYLPRILVTRPKGK